MLSKKTKILIIGFGSIGQRHYKNLRNLGFKNIRIYDVNKDLIKGKNLIKSINKKELQNFDVAFICSPNHLHIKHALACANAGCDLFIEKPLSHSLKDIKKLENLCKKNKLINLVGCNMRFHPCLEFIKKYLDSKKLGKIYSIDHEVGHYLPNWRKGKDYRKNYAAKKSTGGGIIFDSVHEFDLLFWLNNFFDVVDSKFIFDKVGDLDIQTEDICRAIFKFKNNVFGSVHCDYLQKTYSRSCKIIGDKANLEWDFNENTVWLLSEKSKKRLFFIKNYNLNEMYVDEIKYFFDCINKRKNAFNDIKIAGKVLEYCVKRV